MYAEADQSWTTVDTSSGTSTSIPGSATDNYLFTFTNPGNSPQLTGSVDTDTALAPVSSDDNETALSDVLDSSLITAMDANAPAPLATDAFGQLTGGVDQPPPPGTCGSGPCPAHAASWAVNHDCSKPDKYACNNGYTDDCTDFVSRALHTGGGFPEISHGNRFGH